jgi:hypothetical protein
VGRPEADGGAGSAAFGFDLAVARRRVGDEPGVELTGRLRDRVDRPLERRLVRLGRLLHPAHLAHVLQRGGADLVLGRGRLEVVERLDVAAHAPSVRRAYRAARFEAALAR